MYNCYYVYGATTQLTFTPVADVAPQSILKPNMHMDSCGRTLLLQLRTRRKTQRALKRSSQPLLSIHNLTAYWC